MRKTKDRRGRCLAHSARYPGAQQNSARALLFSSCCLAVSLYAAARRAWTPRRVLAIGNAYLNATRRPGRPPESFREIRPDPPPSIRLFRQLCGISADASTRLGPSVMTPMGEASKKTAGIRNDPPDGRPPRRRRGASCVPQRTGPVYSQLPLTFSLPQEIVVGLLELRLEASRDLLN